jgi:hypothetical protein
VLIVMKPLEHMFNFAMLNETRFAAGGMLGSLIEGIGGVIARRIFFLYSSPRPTIFLEWFVIAGAFLAWKAGDRKLVGQVAVLMLVVWGVDVVGTLRGLKLEYFIYTDPLVIIAAAWLLAQRADLRHHRWAFQVGAWLLGLHILVSQAEPAKHTFMRGLFLELCGDSPERRYYTRRVEGFSYCPSVRSDRASSLAGGNPPSGAISATIP